MNKPTLIATFLFLLTSCSDLLNEEPEQAISTNVALSTEQGVKTALIGTYDLLSLISDQSWHVILLSEAFADTEAMILTGNTLMGFFEQIFNKNIAATNKNVEGDWVGSYRTINQANTVLDAVEVVQDESERDQIAAELRFIRAMVYFDLINMYAQPWTTGNPESNLGVPLVSTPSKETLINPEIPRSSVAEVYDFIIEDLSFAKAKLPEVNGVYATTYAASALLSRVYLMQENFINAASEADRVINSGLHELLDNHEFIFNRSDNSAEDIFAIQFTSQDGRNDISRFYTGELEGGFGNIGIKDEHMSRYEMDDNRAELFYFDQLNGIRRTGKWRVNASNDGNITIIRLAEMYLTRAEGRFRTDDVEGALEDLNVIRNRAGLPSVFEVDLEMILNERFIELVFEGHQYRDTKRNRKMFGSRPFDDPKLIYPIPQREMDVNSNMVQNEGY